MTDDMPAYSPVAMHSIRRWRGDRSFIVLDTSVLRKDWFLKGAGFYALHAACGVMQAQVAIPEIVLDELLANYRTELRDTLRKLSAISSDPIDVSTRVEVEYSKYVAVVNEWRGKYRILTYPGSSHKSIVGRIYESKKPFNRGEAGYKDYLIWRSVVELLDVADDFDAAVVFISANTLDFATSKDDLTLHGDYLSELTVDNRKRLTYFPSVDLYNRTTIGDGFADLLREHPEAAEKLRLHYLSSILNRFLATKRADRKYVTYEATDVSFTISHVQKLSNHQLAISGIMDFTPLWHASPSDERIRFSQWDMARSGLIGDNTWDAHVTLIVSGALEVLKADIDGEAVSLGEDILAVRK